jgi:hypothetical protein
MPTASQGAEMVSGLLFDDQSFSSSLATRIGTIDQPQPSIAHNDPHLALRQASSQLGRCVQGRFKSPVIQDDAHLLTVLRYVEANSLRAKIVADPSDYFAPTPIESGQDNLLTSDHDNRWKSCDWMAVLSTGGLFSSVPDRRSVPAYL